MSEPTTAAGRALLRRLDGPDEDFHRYGDVIAAIEAEAAAAARARLQPLIDAATAVCENWSNPDRQNPGVAQDALIEALAVLDGYESWGATQRLRERLR